MQNRKNKAITFSYDDGITQDIRLIELFDKYGIKCTFNINSEMFGLDERIPREGVEVSLKRLNKSEIRETYKNHEVAVHTLTHPVLTRISDEEIIRQVEQDRLNLSDIVGYEVVGMAYPCGDNNDHIGDIIKNNTGVKYARTVTPTYNFDVQTNLYRFNPTIHHHGAGFEKLTEIATQFLETETDKPQILYIWGHGFEFDIRDDWNRFEEFLKLIAFKDDIFYGTNTEVLLNYNNKS